ncbi:hypothetical protein BR93DRAFT_919671 [Coniochaeta sp. PMI_546]|nr:hypothetical protein BR93DRAFT_919671 [Coniochaeta sp. PMI_546]
MTSAAQGPSRSCHNCRRRRLRCDRSRPTCLKCTANGQQCLGYGALLRWTHAVASRGKMAGRTTFEKHGDDNVELVGARGAGPSLSVASSLLDPLLHELGSQGQFYAHHFATSVCSDLVSFDQPDQNPFRFMIPLMGKYPYLRDIVLATSAMHLATHHRCNGQPIGAELVHALSARQNAVRQLRAVMTHINDDNRSAILAAVVFFVNFDLVDSGKGTWKAHLDAAGVLINALYGRSNETAPPRKMFGLDEAMARLIDVIVADCLTYHILGSTLTAVDEPTAKIYDNIDVSAVLRRAEAYSYHCCPPTILQIVVWASRLGHCGNLDTLRRGHRHQQDRAGIATSLLLQALAFDVQAWVGSISNLSADDDRDARVRLASAHRAAACLYIILISPVAVLHCRGERISTETFVAEILGHLSFVPSDHVLFKGSVWPSFMAGAQTDDLEQRQWCMFRLRSMWQSSPWICPWGYVETAMGTLKSVWAARDALQLGEQKTWNWLKQLKESGHINCLIV